MHSGQLVLNSGTARVGFSYRFSHFAGWRGRARTQPSARNMGNPKSLVLSLKALRRRGSLADDVEKVPQPRGSRAARVEKWKRMLYMGSMTSATVLVLNLVMVLWASLRDSKDGKGVLRVDNCDRIKELSTGIHLLINILSTLLLAASNFAMVWSGFSILQHGVDTTSAAMSRCTDQEGRG